MTFFEYFLVEAFENAYAAWVKSGASEEAVELAVDAFKLLKQRQILKGSEGDISPWVKKPFPEFQKFVQEKQAQFQQKNLQKQTASAADKVFENDRCLVVVPHTYEASCKYGANTKWCTASNKTDSHWQQNTKNNMKFYYIIPKDNSGKFAVAVYPHQPEETDVTSKTYNAQDRLVKLLLVLKKFQIPQNLFKNIFTWQDWLKKHKHEVHADGSISVFEDVDLSNQKLKKLPFRFQKVGGGFYCGDNQLTSLAGAPREVAGNFYCGDNQLTSLEGAPQEVDGDFSCSSNQLTSLAGVPQKVGGDFSCGDNQLTSLAGAPREVDGNFYCNNNQLTSLAGAPQKVGGYFFCVRNQLTSLAGAPQKVGGSFACGNNQLTSLAGAPREVGGDFSCDRNPIPEKELLKTRNTK